MHNFCIDDLQCIAFLSTTVHGALLKSVSSRNAKRNLISGLDATLLHWMLALSAFHYNYPSKMGTDGTASASGDDVDFVHFSSMGICCCPRGFIESPPGDFL